MITGTVTRGDGYGRKLGFPTANLSVISGEVPKEGIYSGIGILDGKEYRAGIVIGPHQKTEAHLIGYNGDAYGKELKLQIKKFLREYRNFDTEEELINQIKEDISLC